MFTASTETERFARIRQFEQSLYLLPYETLREECKRLHIELFGTSHYELYISLGGYADMTDCIGELAYQFAHEVPVFGEVL